ncbi:MAG TPA: DNA polymerase III subunit delta' [Accumulibacter sp.]|nr:DNA polymerase III subunit delta' [Accumulibacter sp.]
MKIQQLHPPLWQQLQNRRAQLPHALLLSGQRGLGKFALASAFAAALLCERTTAANEACGTCPACGWLAQGNHPDWRLLQPAATAGGDSADADSDEGGKKKGGQQITIDQVRALDDFLHVGTHRRGARLVLIHPAEAMNRATANALLKSLEEPLPGTLFLLLTNEAHRLLPTIRSRCQVLPVARPAHSLAVEWLRDAGVTDADRWLALAGGAPLLAMELASSGEKALLDAWLTQALRVDDGDALASAAELEKTLKTDSRPAAMKRLLEWVQKWLYDLTLASHALPPRYYLAQSAQLCQLAGRSDPRKLLAFNRKTLQYKKQCEQPLNNRLFLEEFFLSYLSLFRR